MPGKITSDRMPRSSLRTRSTVLPLIILLITAAAAAQTPPDQTAGLYFPSSRLGGRGFQSIVYYMQASGMNLAVLHAKDPNGRLFWKAVNRTALAMNAPVQNPGLETAVNKLKQIGIWTAVKVDVFQDSLLVKSHPELGVSDSQTGGLWADRKGLHWANPYDKRVWEYNIKLCLELIEIGVDEIQFDYIRFPSDGDMSRIEYPISVENTSHAECIEKFLAYAHARLKPAGVVLSIDLFGLTAWKSDDFGVGQVLDHIEPYVDVLCPMLYPSHFPDDFLTLKNPSQYPHRIVKLSLEEMRERTDKPIRPWIQGFWYTPEEISAQIQAVEDCGIAAWASWSPTGRYLPTFQALAERGETTYAPPEFYPTLDKLRSRDDRISIGLTRVVNHTSYREGYSIISLDESLKGEKNGHATLYDVVYGLDESIIDRILSRRGRTFSDLTSPYTKVSFVTRMIIEDLDIDPRRMRPSPIYVEWDGDCRFTKAIPPQRLETYRSGCIDQP